MMSETGQSNGSRSPEEVRAEIERAREQIASSLFELRREVAVRTDWREWIRRRPGVAIGTAFAVGLWLGTRKQS